MYFLHFHLKISKLLKQKETRSFYHLRFLLPSVVHGSSSKSQTFYQGLFKEYEGN